MFLEQVVRDFFCGLRVVEAPKGKTFQQMPRTLIFWDLPGNSVASSASLSTPPTSRLSKREGRIHWEGEDIFLWKRVVRVLHISTHPNPPLERWQKFFLHLEKWEAWAMGASENFTMSQQLCPCQSRKSWCRTTISGKIFPHPRSLTFLPLPPTLWLQRLKEGWTGARSRDKTHYTSLFPSACSLSKGSLRGWGEKF